MVLSTLSGLAVGMRLSFGGVLCGMIFGFITYILISSVQQLQLERAHTANAQVILSLVCAFSAFSFAESYFEVR